MTFSLTTWSKDKKIRLEQLMCDLFEEASQLHTACHYPIQTGGKRMRPLFLFAMMEALEQELTADAYLCAASLEMIHTYSLVHDDLPCMDDDDFRRGKPTVHKVYTDGIAVLVGDSLLTKAFEILAKLNSSYLPKILSCIGKAAGSEGMIGGQSLDIGLEGEVNTLDRLTLLHRRKTGALIQCAVEMAGILSNVTPSQQEKINFFGQEIGLAFQLADDILDAEEDSKVGGPPSFVKILGIDETTRQANVHLQNALDVLDMFQNPTALIALTKYTVQREH